MWAGGETRFTSLHLTLSPTIHSYLIQVVIVQLQGTPPAYAGATGFFFVFFFVFFFTCGGNNGTLALLLPIATGITRA